MSGSGKSGIVDEWRKQHLDELDKTLAVLISIRDDTGEESKNRIDASKAIARRSILNSSISSPLGTI